MPVRLYAEGIDSPEPMSIREYQEKTKETAIYPKEAAVIYPLLGLAGEVGELLNKLKKVYRDRGARVLSIHTIPASVMQQVADEIGDIKWYLSTLCNDLHLNEEQIARDNLAKLRSRKERGKLKGEGDAR